MRKKNPDKMAKKLSKILNIEASAIKVAYADDVGSLTKVFNLATRYKTRVKLNLATSVMSGVVAVTFVVAPPVGTSVGLVAFVSGSFGLTSLLNGYDLYKDSKADNAMVEEARKEVQTRIDQKSSGPK